MKLTTKSRYGMNAMYELVTRYGQGPVPLKMIAEKQNIPEAFLEQMMNQLRKAELVTSIRGAQGGYTLSRKPEEISVGEVPMGVYVTEIAMESPAMEAGIQSGDIIIKMNTQTITGFADYRKALSEWTPGELGEIILMRRGQEGYKAAKAEIVVGKLQ